MAGAILPRRAQHFAFRGAASEDLGAGHRIGGERSFRRPNFDLTKGATSRSLGQGDSLFGVSL